MPSKHVTKYLLPLIAVSLIACTSVPDERSSPPRKNHEKKPSAVRLPLAHNRWTIWRCKDGSKLETRFKGHGERLLELKYQGSRHVLIDRSTDRLAIYQDNRIAFFSDGKSATIGQPESDLIYNTGCRIVP